MMLIKTAPYAPGDSYVDVATADAFHILRGTTAWINDTNVADRTAALILASDYISANYRLINTLDLSPAIVTATMTLAPAMLTASAIAPTDNRAIIEQTVIGPVGLQKTTKWSPTAGISDPFPMITSILAPAIMSTNGITVIPLVR